jgi:preprotein translocase subunit SecD
MCTSRSPAFARWGDELGEFRRWEDPPPGILEWVDKIDPEAQALLSPCHGRSFPSKRIGNTSEAAEMVVDNDDIAQAWVVDDATPQFGVSVQLLPGGAERMRNATANHVGRPVAILIDGIVVMAPIVRTPIFDAAVISGQFTREEATRITEGVKRR